MSPAAPDRQRTDRQSDFESGLARLPVQPFWRSRPVAGRLTDATSRFGITLTKAAVYHHELSTDSPFTANVRGRITNKQRGELGTNAGYPHMLTFGMLAGKARIPL